MNKINSRSRLLMEKIISDHDDKLHRCTIFAIIDVPLVPEEVFDSKSVCLFRKLATKGGIARDDDGNATGSGEDRSKDGNGLPGTGGHNREHALIFVLKNC